MNQQGGANKDGSRDDRIGQTVGDRVQRDSQGFDSLCIDFMLQRYGDIPSFDTIPKNPEITWENLEKINRGSSQLL